MSHWGFLPLSQRDIESGVPACRHPLQQQKEGKKKKLLSQPLSKDGPIPTELARRPSRMGTV